MKNIIFIFGIILCTFGNIFAQYEGSSENPTNWPKPKMPWFNAGFGTSFRMGTLLFPSLDAFVDVGPVTLEGYWKDAVNSRKELSSFGLGTNLRFLKTKDDVGFFVSYFYVFNSEFEYQELNDLILTTNENILCIGIQGNSLSRLQCYFSLGAAFVTNSKFEDRWDPRIEIGFRLFLRDPYYLNLH